MNNLPQGAIAIPTGKAGELYIPALDKTVQQVEWREDDFYDHVQTKAAITAGNRLRVFRSLDNKNFQHININTQGKIPANSEIVIFRIGVHVAQAFGNVLPTDDDIIKVAHAATLTFKLNERLVAQGPLFKFQSGYGVTGSTTRNATGIATMGVPSAAAAPQLLVAQPASEKDDLNCDITFEDNSWLASGTQMPAFSIQAAVTTQPVIGVFLHGLIKKPQGT
jgi:hypothetical protein